MPTLLTEGLSSQHSFVKGASEEFLNELEEFSHETSFDAGAIILAEGAYADKCFLIRNGRVQLEARANGNPVLLQTLGAGDTPRLVMVIPAISMALYGPCDRTLRNDRAKRPFPDDSSRGKSCLRLRIDETHQHAVDTPTGGCPRPARPRG